jgi:site-specific DNA-methyltransferase (adenine-specific)
MTRFTLHHGDSREVLKGLAESSVDSIVCDPPYHLTTGKKGGSGPASVNLDTPQGRARVTTGFMGMTWDGGDVAQSVELWAEALRILKPGGYLLAFSGTRTYHRMVCAIEDAGFEIRDQIAWTYGSGFPKSHNGEWGGTALKPAWEPIVMARKPLIGTVEANWREHGTGALNIGACRIEGESTLREKAAGRGQFPREDDAWEPKAVTVGSDVGRWPANLIHDGSDEVVALFPREAGAAAPVTVRNGDKFRGTYGAFAGNIDEAGSTFHGDSGSAARFFYCAKASREDRDEGCGAIPARQYSHDGRETSIDNAYQRNSSNSSNSSNSHPTVKPTDLMAYLCRLVTPPGGTVLDPFMGSGSTGKAAMLEGFSFIGIDMTPEYVEIARARIEFALRQGHQPSLLEAA